MTLHNMVLLYLIFVYCFFLIGRWKVLKTTIILWGLPGLDGIWDEIVWSEWIWRISLFTMEQNSLFLWSNVQSDKGKVKVSVSLKQILIVSVLNKIDFYFSMLTVWHKMPNSHHIYTVGKQLIARKNTYVQTFPLWSFIFIIKKFQPDFELFQPRAIKAHS